MLGVEGVGLVVMKSRTTHRLPACIDQNEERISCSCHFIPQKLKKKEARLYDATCSCQRCRVWWVWQAVQDLEARPVRAPQECYTEQSERARKSWWPILAAFPRLLRRVDEPLGLHIALPTRLEVRKELLKTALAAQSLRNTAGGVDCRRRHLKALLAVTRT